MSDDSKPSRSWLERLSHAFDSGPENKSELLETLRAAVDKQLIDHESLTMIEGVLNVSTIQVRDIMIPRAQIVFVTRGQSSDEFLPLIVQSAHSRYPVLNEDRSDVVGMLLTKDLLKYYFANKNQSFLLTDALMRPAFFVPESKRLDALLKEFRSSRNHLAVVVDEYGSTSGLITIEDVLEEIVGDIEDEYDTEEEALIIKQDDRHYLISALTPVEDFNHYFHSQFSDKEVDTMGGVVMQQLGFVPKQGDSVNMDRFTFTVHKANERRIISLQLMVHDQTISDSD
jgi:magnesium and cobalt transporter